MNFSLASSRRVAAALSVFAVSPVAEHVARAPAPPRKSRFQNRRCRPTGARSRSSSGGDIWTVPAAGGEARLLVSHPAYDSRPLYSPDGTRLAFMSTRTGNGDIYVLTLATGQLKRITFDDVPDQLDAWSRDGQWIYLSSGSKDVNGMNDIYRVSADGGTPMPVSADRFTQEYWAAPSPTDAEHDRVHGARRHGVDVVAAWPQPSRREPDLVEHFGGEAPQYEQITKDEARSAWPMWSGDGKTLYFVSDKSGPENVWSKTAARRRRACGHGVQDGPRAVADDVVRRQGDGVRARLPRLDARRRERQGERSADHPARREPGARRGTSDADRGLPVARAVAGRKEDRVHGARRGVRGVGARRRRRVARDDTRRRSRPSSPGRPTAAGSRTRRRATARATSISTTSARARRRSSPTDRANDVAPRWSPDGKCIAFMRGAKELRVLDVATKQDRVLATGQLDRTPFLPDHPIAWSPDGRWIAYLNGGQGAFQNPSYRRRRTADRRDPRAFCRTRTADRSRGARTAPICCSTRRSARRKARSYASISSRARRGSAKISSAICSSSRRARARRPSPRRVQRRRERDTTAPRADSSRGAGSTRDGDRVRRHSPPRDAAAGRRRRARRRHQPRRQDGADRARAPRVSRTCTRTRSTNCRGQPAVARQLTSTPGFKQNAQFTADSKEVYYLENGRISSINVESRQVRPGRGHRGARRRLLEGEGRRVPPGVDDSRRQLLRREDERRRLEGARRPSTSRTSPARRTPTRCAAS